MVLLYLEERYNVSLITRTVLAALEQVVSQQDGPRPLSEALSASTAPQADPMFTHFLNRCNTPLPPCLLNLALVGALLPYTASSLAIFEGDLRANLRFPPSQHWFDSRSGRGTPFQTSVGPTGVSLGAVLVGDPQSTASASAQGLALLLQHLAAVCAVAGDHGTSHLSAMRADSDYPPVFYPARAGEEAAPMHHEHAFTLMYLKLASARERLLLQVEGYNMLAVMETNSPDYARYAAAVGRLVFCDIYLNLLETYCVAVLDVYFDNPQEWSLHTPDAAHTASWRPLTVGYRSPLHHLAVVFTELLPEARQPGYAQVMALFDSCAGHQLFPLQFALNVSGNGAWTRAPVPRHYQPGCPPPGTFAHYVASICGHTFSRGEPSLGQDSFAAAGSRGGRSLLSAGLIKSSMALLRRRAALAETDRYLYNTLSRRGGYAFLALAFEATLQPQLTRRVGSSWQQADLPPFARWRAMPEHAQGALFWGSLRERSADLVRTLVRASLLLRKDGAFPEPMPRSADALVALQGDRLALAVRGLWLEVALCRPSTYVDGVYGCAHGANGAALVGLATRHALFACLCTEPMPVDGELASPTRLALLPVAAESVSPAEAALLQRMFTPDLVYTLSLFSRHLTFLPLAPPLSLSLALTRAAVQRLNSACAATITEHHMTASSHPATALVFPHGTRPLAALQARSDFAAPLPRLPSLPGSLSSVMTSDAELNLLLHRARLSLQAGAEPSPADTLSFAHYHATRARVSDLQAYLSHPPNACGLTDALNLPVIIAPHDGFPPAYRAGLFETVPLEPHHNALLYRVSDHSAHADSRRYVLGEEVHRTNLGGVYKARRRVAPQFLYSNCLQLSPVSWPAAEYLLDPDHRQFGLVFTHARQSPAELLTPTSLAATPPTPSAAAVAPRGARRSPLATTLSVTLVLSQEDAEHCCALTVAAHEVYRAQGVANTVVEYSYDALTFVPFCVLAGLDDCPRTYELGNIRGARYWRLTRHDATVLALGCVAFEQTVAVKRSLKSKLLSNKCGDDPRRECEYYTFLSGHPNTPNILAVHDNDLFDRDYHCIISQFLGGQDVYHLLSRDRDPRNLVMIPEPDIALLFAQVALAVYYMHHHKRVVHLDIKPANILLSTNYKRAYVADFGVARRIVPRGVPFHESLLHDLGDNPRLRQLMAANEGSPRVPAFAEVLPMRQGPVSTVDFLLDVGAAAEEAAAAVIASDKRMGEGEGDGEGDAALERGAGDGEAGPHSSSSWPAPPASGGLRAALQVHNAVDIIDHEPAEPVHDVAGVAGTRDYMAPEIIAKHRQRSAAPRYARCKYTHRDRSWCAEAPIHNSPYCREHHRLAYGYDPRKADVFSLGVVLFTMLTKVPPYMNFADDNNVHWVQLKRYGVSHMIREYARQHPNIRVSDEAIDLMQHMVAENPDQRYFIEDVVAHPWTRRALDRLRAIDMATHAHLN